jgi:DNA helicase-2/ATP-dependent DNA helicase PcrA
MNLAQLNPMQKKAAETLQGPLLIIAGAGSGKTRTMTYRIANLISKGVKPWSILALTFTNKAAKEMQGRVEKLVGDMAKDIWVGTFHSVCVRILRRDIERIDGFTRSFVIYDEDDQSKVLKDVYKNLNVDEKQLPIRQMRGIISDAKNRLLLPDDWFRESSRDYRSQKIHDVFVAYNQRLKESNALDFDDIISFTLQLFTQHPEVLENYRRRFEYVHVDEYQDTNFAQYSLVRLISGNSRNLCVVGDDDQSIYGWRGADIRNILEFQKDFPDATVIKLEQNYRSTKTILEAANNVIQKNTGRMEKVLWTDDEEGDLIHFFEAIDEREEGAWVCERIRILHKREEPYQQIAILYRTHAQSRVLEEMLMQAGIPYRIFGGTRFYDRKEIRDVLSYLRLIVNPKDDVALKRIINVPKRSIGDATVAVLERNAFEKGQSMYETVLNVPEDLASRPKKCVTNFAEMMQELVEAADTMPLSDFVQMVLEKSTMLEEYEKSLDEEMQTRKENLLEFVSAAKDFEEASEDKSLSAFLENVALVTDLDMHDLGQDYVTLMTMHSAKGLEFNSVFLMGLEEGVFPSYRSVQEEGRLEEERRLCYVGMTRARKNLFISHAKRRTLYNQTSYNAPSRFIDEIPEELINDRWGEQKRKYFGEEVNKIVFEKPRPRKQPRTSFGAPGMGQSMPAPQDIPGVFKGIIPSIAQKAKQPPKVFNAGDRVLHKKFGEGTVKEVTGTGAEARISIAFTAYGEKQFALSIAPIAKIEK